MLIDKGRYKWYPLFWCFRKALLGPRKTQCFSRLAGRILMWTSACKSFITLNIVFRADESARMIKARYLVIDTPYSYYMIIRCPAFNQLGSVMSTLYLCMKYLLPDGWVRDIQWARKPPWGVIWIVLSWKKDYGYGPCPSTRHTWS